MRRHLAAPALGIGVLVMGLTAGCNAGSTTSADHASPARPATARASKSPAPAAPTTSAPALPTSPVTPSPSQTAASALDASTCHSQDLELSQASIEGAAGSSYVTYYLANRGTSSCRLDGYPGVAMLAADGSVIQRPADRDTMAHSAVRLRPGARAQFIVRTRDASVPGTGCSPRWKTAQVQVYPPGETAAIKQPSSVRACDLTVGPLSPAPA